jgi:DNA-directed RNA polymerase subunit RPC12/RpoP
LQHHKNLTNRLTLKEASGCYTGTFSSRFAILLLLTDAAMAIVCPHCEHKMIAKGAIPGRYKPKCAKCGQAFGVTIFEDRDPISQILPKPEPAATMAPSETVPHAPQRSQPPDFGLPVGPELLSLAAGGVLGVLGLLFGRTKAE